MLIKGMFMNMKKIIVIFLVANFIVGLGLFVFAKVASQTTGLAAEKTQTQSTQPMHDNKNLSMQQQPIMVATCMRFGPLNPTEAEAFNLLVGDSKSLLENPHRKSVQTINVYQLYWNLGTNEAVARSLFDRQKRGAMSDDKFQLRRGENGNWLVNITEVAGSEELVKELTVDLAEKANKVNAGGTWSFRLSHQSSLFTINEFNMINAQTKNEINSKFGTVGQPCVG